MSIRSEFNDRIKEAAITVLNEGGNIDASIKLGCNKCGYDWYDTMHNIAKRQYVCPQCKDTGKYKVYMGVTNDEIELPITIPGTASEVAEQMNLTPREVRGAANSNPTRGKFKIVTVEIDENVVEEETA